MPKCHFSKLDSVLKYDKDTGIFKIKLGCPRCKFIWFGILIEENTTDIYQWTKNHEAIGELSKNNTLT